MATGIDMFKGGGGEVRIFTDAITAVPGGPATLTSDLEVKGGVIGAQTRLALERKDEIVTRCALCTPVTIDKGYRLIKEFHITTKLNETASHICCRSIPRGELRMAYFNHITKKSLVDRAGIFMTGTFVSIDVWTPSITFNLRIYAKDDVVNLEGKEDLFTTLSKPDFYPANITTDHIQEPRLPEPPLPVIEAIDTLLRDTGIKPHITMRPHDYLMWAHVLTRDDYIKNYEILMRAMRGLTTNPDIGVFKGLIATKTKPPNWYCLHGSSVLGVPTGGGKTTFGVQYAVYRLRTSKKRERNPMTMRPPPPPAIVFHATDELNSITRGKKRDVEGDDPATKIFKNLVAKKHKEMEKDSLLKYLSRMAGKKLAKLGGHYGNILFIAKKRTHGSILATFEAMGVPKTDIHQYKANSETIFSLMTAPIVLATPESMTKTFNVTKDFRDESFRSLDRPTIQEREDVWYSPRSGLNFKRVDGKYTLPDIALAVDAEKKTNDPGWTTFKVSDAQKFTGAVKTIVCDETITRGIMSLPRSNCRHFPYQTPFSSVYWDLVVMDEASTASREWTKTLWSHMFLTLTATMNFNITKPALWHLSPFGRSPFVDASNRSIQSLSGLTLSALPIRKTQAFVDTHKRIVHIPKARIIDVVVPPGERERKGMAPLVSLIDTYSSHEVPVVVKAKLYNAMRAILDFSKKKFFTPQDLSMFLGQAAGAGLPTVWGKGTVSFEDEEDNICNICQDEFSDVVARPNVDKCIHLFCEGCINQWVSVSKKKECPLCKREYEGLELRKLATAKEEEGKEEDVTGKILLPHAFGHPMSSLVPKTVDLLRERVVKEKKRYLTITNTVEAAKALISILRVELGVRVFDLTSPKGTDLADTISEYSDWHGGCVAVGSFVVCGVGVDGLQSSDGLVIPEATVMDESRITQITGRVTRPGQALDEVPVYVLRFSGLGDAFSTRSYNHNAFGRVLAGFSSE